MSHKYKCGKCEKTFAKGAWFRRHLARKTPCSDIVEKEDLPEDKKESPNKCKFCGRPFASAATLLRHIQQSCKIAPRNGDTTGMEKLYDHVVRKQNIALEKSKRDELEKELEAKIEAKIEAKMEAKMEAKVAEIMKRL